MRFTGDPCLGNFKNLTIETYWDCNCEGDDFHKPYFDMVCKKCGAERDDSSDALLREVLQKGIPIIPKLPQVPIAKNIFDLAQTLQEYGFPVDTVINGSYRKKKSGLYENPKEHIIEIQSNLILLFDSFEKSYVRVIVRNYDELHIEKEVCKCETIDELLSTISTYMVV
jgi:hypothetical protein